MFANRPLPGRPLQHFSESEEEDEIDGEIEVLCNARVEQTVPGRAPIERTCREAFCRYACSDGAIHVNMKSTVVTIRILKNPNARIHANHIMEGKLCVRDIKRAVMIVISEADPKELLRLKHLIMESSGTRPRSPKASIGKRSSPGKRRSPLKVMDHNKRSPKHRRTDKKADGEEEADVRLCEEQMKAVEAAMGGDNIFITGGAGTGKSVVLREIIRRLPPATTFVTASTGVAACNVNGCTLHHFAGLGRGGQSVEEMACKAERSGAAQRWRRAKTLVIDEISMVSGETFDQLNRLAKLVRNSTEPFGGVQVVLCGDFFQLPPVTERGAAGAALCFEARAWGEAAGRVVELKAVHRQSDQDFVRILNDIRWGKCSQRVLAMMRERSGRGGQADDATATKLMTHRSDVDRTNTQELEGLEAEARTFEATDEGDSQALRLLSGQCTAPASLTLKVGALVILLKSLSPARGLVNGARGVVEAFTKGLGLPVVRFDNGEKETLSRESWGAHLGSGRSASRSQVPLNLAWAMSIHKSQGISLASVQVSLSRVFEAGQAYVALSRARSLAGLTVLDFSPTAIRADPRVLEFYRSLSTSEEAEEGGGGEGER